MKLLSWNTFLIMSGALCLLVFGGIILSCQTVRLEAKRHPHEHLQTSALEPRATLRTVDYKLPRGETLNGVAKLRYGHRNYYQVIKLYNRLEDEAQVAADYQLRLPDMSVILTDEGVTKVAAQEVTLILCSRAKYDRVVDQLWALRSGSTDSRQVSEDIKRELLEAADDLQQATESLKMNKPGVSAVPEKMIGQLEQAMEGMRYLAKRGLTDLNGYDIDMVQQRYALDLTYAIIWARDGFR